MSSIELPNEIWVEILSSLDYGQLKTCERVSKSFQALILNAPALAKIVFRSRRVLDSRDDIDVFELHPVFSALRFGFPCYKHENQGIVFKLGVSNLGATFDGNKWEQYGESSGCLADIAAAEEYATEPPVKVLKIDIDNRYDYCQAKGAPESGVTVLQAMEAILDYFEYESGSKTPDMRAWFEMSHQKGVLTSSWLVSYKVPYEYMDL